MIDPLNPDIAADRTRPLPRADRIGIDVLLGITVLVAAVFVWTLSMSVVQKFGTEGFYVFTLPLGGNPSTVALPDPPDATIIGATQVNDAIITLGDVPEELRNLVLAQHVLAFAIAGTVVAAFATVLLRLRAGRPFMRSTTVVLMITSIALMVLGTASEVLDNVVDGVATEVITGGRHDTALGTAWSWEFTGVWLFVGALLGTVAGAFSIGERTERERRRLQHDTEGLV